MVIPQLVFLFIMSPLRSMTSLHELQKSRQFYSVVLGARLLMALGILWQLNTLPTLSSLYANFSLNTLPVLYAVLVTLAGLALVSQPGRTAGVYALLILDGLLAGFLPFLMPNQALVTVDMALLLGLSLLTHALPWRLILLLLLSYGASALAAGWYYQTLWDHQIQPAHGLGLFIALLVLLQQLKSALPAGNAAMHATTPFYIQRQHLASGISFLYPYHRRNQIPLSLLMVRIQKPARPLRQFSEKLLELYKTRCRSSDILVQLDNQHIGLLLCDTSPGQASHLVKALMDIYQQSALVQVQLCYAVCALPLEQPIALDDIIQQMTMSLIEAEQQQVNRLIFVHVRQTDSL